MALGHAAFDGRSLPGGVWMAYYSDRSAVVPFSSEIEALRHAVTCGMGMAVRYAAYGDEDWMTGEPIKPLPLGPQIR